MGDEIDELTETFQNLESLNKEINDLFERRGEVNEYFKLQKEFNNELVKLLAYGLVEDEEEETEQEQEEKIQEPLVSEEYIDKLMVLREHFVKLQKSVEESVSVFDSILGEKQSDEQETAQSE